MFRGAALTLLLVVLIAVAFVATTLWPNFMRARASGQVTACQANLKNLAVALEMYASKNGGRFPSTLQALAPGYLASLPTCPGAGRDSYSKGYSCTSGPGRRFTLACVGRNHGWSGRPADHPQYGSRDGIIP